MRTPKKTTTAANFRKRRRAEENPKRVREMARTVILIPSNTPKDSKGRFIMPSKTKLAELEDDGFFGYITLHRNMSAEELHQLIISCFNRKCGGV